MKGLIEGRIVHYVLTDEDAKQINILYQASMIAKSRQHVGNNVMTGEHFPAIITRVFHNEFGNGEPGVNMQVFLDGNDSHWVVSKRFAQPAELKNGTWHWIEEA